MRSCKLTAISAAVVIVCCGLLLSFGIISLSPTSSASSLLQTPWVKTNELNGPTGIQEPGIVWTGNEIIVWGGANAGGLPVGTGGIYSPAFDAWLPGRDLDRPGAPKARFHHTAVWSGSEMIVWGGSSTTNGTFNDGARYNPTFDNWLPISQTEAPGAREYHTAVWTGQEMIVWGGILNRALSNNGGRYNPVTDTWTVVSADSGAPSARSQHTAVWTGQEMIIWGGKAGRDLPQTGARYNPRTNTWKPTSLTGAPTGRSQHTAIWTGTEMIIWGGDGKLANGKKGSLNTGAKYNPVTDTWTPTTVERAPEARSLHTAVWTGIDMIVWGGTAKDFMNTGYRYDPVADQWTPVTIAGAPQARSLHGAVWTGDQMIVWGGLGDRLVNFNPLPKLTALKSGGRYRPSAD